MKTRSMLLIVLMGLAAHAAAQDKLKVGFLSTLTGPISGIAVDMQDGFKLGVKQAGGKLGGMPTELVIGDDQQNPDTGKQVFDKMVKKDRIDIVTGIMFTNVMYAIAPIEPPRDSRRPHFLRGWGHEHIEEVLPGSSGARGTGWFSSRKVSTIRSGRRSVRSRRRLAARWRRCVAGYGRPSVTRVDAPG